MSSYLHGEIFTVGSPKNQCLGFCFFFNIFINDWGVSIVTLPDASQFIVDTESL